MKRRPTLTQWFDVLWGIAFGVVVMWLVCWVSEEDYQDEVAAFNHTCEMIDAGAWPAELEPACAGEEKQ